MHGFLGWGHDCDGDWGLGWIFPALLLGRLISDSIPRQTGWPHPPPPQPAPQPPQQSRPPAPARAETTAALGCRHCHHALQPEFAFCPGCGQRVAPPTCRYCGQTLKRDMAYCTHCGGPTR
ncbi:MAG: zinc ribbon domain-containing protein [Anaerolineales bacterium]